MTIELAPMGIKELIPANIALMKKQADEIQIDLETGKEYTNVKAMHIQAKDLDLKIRKRLAELNDPLNEQRKKNNETAKKAQSMVEPIIEILGQKRLSWENILEKRKKEREEKEHQRVQNIRSKINDISNMVTSLNGLPSDQLETLKSEIDAIQIDPDEYMEFTAEANQAKHNAFIAASDAYENRIKFEKEEAERKALAEQLKKQKEEQEAEAKRLEGIRLENERKQKEAEAKIAEEKANIEAEKLAIEKAKQDEIDRKEREEKEKREAEEAEKRAEIEAKEDKKQSKSRPQGMIKYEVETQWSGYSRGLSVYLVEAGSEEEAKELWYEGERIHHETIRDDTENEVIGVKEVVGNL